MGRRSGLGRGLGALIPPAAGESESPYRQLPVTSIEPNPQQPPSDDSQYQRLAQAVQKVEQQIQDTQAELQGAREKLASASPARRRAAQSLVDELQSEVGLLDARRDAIQSMLEFVSTSSTGTGNVGLGAQIEELARS